MRDSVGPAAGVISRARSRWALRAAKPPRLFAVMVKDLRLIGRDRTALVSLLVVPVLVIVLIAEIQSGKGTQGILFPVVNEDQGPVANALIKVFAQHLDVRQMDRATAERTVAVDNRAAAYLLLPAGMSKRYLTNKPSTLKLVTDPAQWEELQAIRVIFLLADREAASLGDPFSEELLHLEESSATSRHLRFSSLEQRVPGFSVMFVLMNLIFSVAFGLRDEEIWGTSRRLSMAPVSRLTVLSGKLLARWLVGTVQLLLLLLFGHFVYGLTLGDSPLTMLPVSACIVFALACFSTIIAAVARTREQVIPVGMLAVFFLAALGGCWWPFFSQPAWMQMIGRGVVTTWSMFAIHDVMLRGRAFVDVVPTMSVLVGYGVASFLVGLRFFRFATA
jgi:ABC-type multidrug transport system permease subunit